MNYFLVILVIGFFQEVPLKPNEEFDIKLDYEFKQRPPVDHNTVHLGTPIKNYEHRSSTAVLPYLVLNIQMLKLAEEKMRVHINTNLNGRPVSKKVSLMQVLALDMGFTDDMVDRVTAHEYTLTFLNSEKKAVDRILISVDEDGSFYVNGEKRGKF